jgi:hypothetical protein
MPRTCAPDEKSRRPARRPDTLSIILLISVSDRSATLRPFAAPRAWISGRAPRRPQFSCPPPLSAYFTCCHRGNGRGAGAQRLAGSWVMAHTKRTPSLAPPAHACAAGRAEGEGEAETVRGPPEVGQTSPSLQTPPSLFSASATGAPKAKRRVVGGCADRFRRPRNSQITLRVTTGRSRAREGAGAGGGGLGRTASSCRSKR